MRVSLYLLKYEIRTLKINNKLEFLIACIIQSLEFLHYNNIIHKDVKPENLIFDKDCYLKLTDFGLSRYIVDTPVREANGTPGYMAPEVFTHSKQSFTLDYFAIGIILFELMFGTRPYLGKTKKEVKDQMLSVQYKITEKSKPKTWSYESIDFVNKVSQ